MAIAPGRFSPERFPARSAGVVSPPPAPARKPLPLVPQLRLAFKLFDPFFAAPDLARAAAGAAAAEPWPLWRLNLYRCDAFGLIWL